MNLTHILKQILLEEKKKADRCKRIADRKFDKPSAYKSGAIVRCRQGKIWKDLKEGEFSKFIGSEFGDEHGNIFSVEEVYKFVEANKQKYFKPNFPISKLVHNLEWWDRNYDLNNKEHKRRMINSDTSYPLLVVNEGNNLSVADGLNRLYKAVNIENKKNIDIFLVNKQDIMFLNKKSLNEYKSEIAKLKLLKENLSKIIQEIIQEDESLHKWFKRKGAPGKTGGWVDCNTCRNGKCKPCGRQKGEKRAKYPSCRPTPAACKDKGKGKTWGKTK